MHVCIAAHMHHHHIHVNYPVLNVSSVKMIVSTSWEKSFLLLYELKTPCCMVIWALHLLT